MDDEILAQLVGLNEAIPDREMDGASADSYTFFSDLLGPSFAFRRASGLIIGRQEFLASLKSSEPRRQELLDVALIGRARALVTCIIYTPGPPERRFHNLRCFVRTDDRWRLLAWANEELHET